jgi:hypothetical protein
MITIPSDTTELPSLAYPDAWEDPIFFEAMPTPEIPANLLPGIFGEFAKHLSEAIETPEALSVMAVLGVISTVAAKRFKVSPKAGWEEPLNIYTLIALPPANHKSIVLKYCTQPLIEWEKTQAKLHAQKIKQQLSEQKTQERIIEALRLKAAKIEDKLEQRKAIEEIMLREAALPELPVLPQLFVNDATPESLITTLYEQQGKLAIFSDEGGILETLSGLYSHSMANIDVLLKGIDGGEIRVRRKDKSLMLNPYLTVVLAVQPDIIHHLTQRKAYQGNGTLERFLYVIPKSKLGYRTHDKPALSPALQSAYHEKILALLNEFTNDQHYQQPDLLKLSDKAYQHWQAFQADIEQDLRPQQRFNHCQGWGGKICGFTLRLAGLLHVAEQGAQSLHISEVIMLAAIQLAKYLIEHALAVFDFMGLDQTTADAKEVWQWIVAQPQRWFRQSELLLALRNRKVGRSARLKKALQMLKERNLISDPIKLPTRKPTTVYYVHPSASLPSS